MSGVSIRVQGGPFESDGRERTAEITDRWPEDGEESFIRLKERKQLPVESSDMSDDEGKRDFGNREHDDFPALDEVIQTVPGCLMIMPMIQIQGASPMILSPTDEQSFSNIYNSSHSVIVNMEKVCEQAEIERAQESKVGKGPCFADSQMFEDERSRAFPLINVEDGMDQVAHNTGSSEETDGTGDTRLMEDRDDDDDGVGIGFEEDVGKVTISPTDFTPMGDQPEALSFDASQLKRELFNGDTILVDVITVPTLSNEQLSSLSEHTLLSESVEDSDFNGATKQTIVDEIHLTTKPDAAAENGTESSVADLFNTLINKLQENEMSFPEVVCLSVEGILMISKLFYANLCFYFIVDHSPADSSYISAETKSFA